MNTPNATCVVNGTVEIGADGTITVPLAVTVRTTGGSAERGVPLSDGRHVLDGQRRAARQQPAQRPVEVRTPRGRAALDHREPVRCEDERRHLRAQRLGRAEDAAVQLRALPLAATEHHLELERRRPAAADERDPRGLGADADELRVEARAG